MDTFQLSVAGFWGTNQIAAAVFVLGTVGTVQQTIAASFGGVTIWKPHIGFFVSKAGCLGVQVRLFRAT
jgi:hypothetical protein